MLNPEVAQQEDTLTMEKREFMDRYSVLLDVVLRLREESEAQESRGKFDVDAHQVVPTPSRALIKAERNMINHVIGSSYPFDTQRAFLVVAGVCRQETASEKEFLKESGLVVGDLVRCDSVVHEIVGVKLYFDLGRHTNHADLSVKALVSLDGHTGERFIKLDEQGHVSTTSFTLSPNTT